MAEKTETGAEKPRKNRMKVVIIGIVVFVLLAVAGGGAFLLLGNDESAADEEASEQPVTKKKKKAAKGSAPVYVVFEPFTVNLKPEDGDHYLQVAISAHVDDSSEGERIKLYMPKLRNQIMLLLSDKMPSQLVSKEGKEALAEDIRDQVNTVLEPGAKKGEGPVSEILFTSFIVQ